MTAQKSFIVNEPKINWQKIDSDIDFLKSLHEFCQKKNWRLVLYGGYSLDFAIGKITRPHRDLDIVIFGTEERPSASNELENFILNRFEKSEIIIKNEPFFHDIDITDKNFAGNLYYVQTIEDPFVNLQRVRKSTGEEVINSEDRFPQPIKGKLNDFSIEIQDQHAHLADILYKRSTKIAENKHDDDIVNLQLITDSMKVESLLNLKE